MYVAGQVGFQLGCPSARGKKQDQRYPGIWGNILRERETERERDRDRERVCVCVTSGCSTAGKKVQPPQRGLQNAASVIWTISYRQSRPLQILKSGMI